MVGSEITVKKIVCIVLSIMTAFMLFSAAYGLWEKKLTIKGNFKVVKMEPDFETGIVQKVTPTENPALMEGIVQPAAIEGTGEPANMDATEDQTSTGETEIVNESGREELVQDTVEPIEAVPDIIEENEAEEVNKDYTDDSNQSKEQVPQEKSTPDEGSGSDDIPAENNRDNNEPPVQTENQAKQEYEPDTANNEIIE